MTGGGDDLTSPYQGAYTWNPATVASGAQTVTVTNGQGLTSTGTFTVTRDATNPTGNLTAPASSAIVRGNSVAVSSNSADAGSGVAQALFQRSPAGANTWTDIGTADTTSPYSVNWDTTAVADGLYDLRVVTTDNVNNSFTSALVTSVRVDNTLPTNSLSLQSVAPAGSAFLTGTTVYYRGTAAGSFQLQNSVTDTGSGPATSVFPALGGTVGGWTHTTQTVNTPAGGPYVTTNNFAWPAGRDAEPHGVGHLDGHRRQHLERHRPHLHERHDRAERLGHGTGVERQRQRQLRLGHLELGRRRLRRRHRALPALARRRRDVDDHRRRRHDVAVRRHLGHHGRRGRAL